MNSRFQFISNIVNNDLNAYQRKKKPVQVDGIQNEFSQSGTKVVTESNILF